MKKIAMLLVGVLISQSALSMEEIPPQRFQEGIGHSNIHRINDLLSNESVYNIYGTPSLTNAGYYDHELFFQFPLSLESKTKKKGQNNWTDLIRAAKEGHVRTCSLLLDQGVHVGMQIKSWHTSALNMAAKKGHTDICRLLLERGAQVDAKDEDGFTALMEAAYEGHTAVCKLFLDRGFILPQVDAKKVTEFRKDCVNLCMLFTRLTKMKKISKIPKDMRYYILLTGWDEEIKMLIKQLIRTGWARLIPKHFQGLKNQIINDVAQETFDKLKIEMKAARSSALNDEIRSLLDPKTLDSEKIKNNLTLFSQSRKEL